MNARTMIKLAQSGAPLFQCYLKDLPGLLTTTPKTLAEHIVASTSLQSGIPGVAPVSRVQLSHTTNVFHKLAGTSTQSIQETEKQFLNNSPIIRIAHQPNTFAYLGVFAQFIFLKTLHQVLKNDYNVDVCMAYFAVDYNHIGEKRFSTSSLPDVHSKTGRLNLSIDLTGKYDGKVIFAAKKPEFDLVKLWMLNIEKYLDAHLKDLSRVGIKEKEPGQLRSFWEEVKSDIWYSYYNSKNLEEFNLIFISRLVNIRWDIPVLFFPLSKVVSLMKNHYQILLNLYPDIVKISNEIYDELISLGVTLSNNMRLSTKEFPFWYICDKCNTRVSLKMDTNHEVKISGTCKNCHANIEHNLGLKTNINIDDIYTKLIPKVFFDVMLDMIGWGIAGGTGYIGAAEHAIIVGKTALRLGWMVPTETLWQPRATCFGASEILASVEAKKDRKIMRSKKHQTIFELIFSGRASILYYLLNCGYGNLLDGWEQHFYRGGNTHEIMMQHSAFTFNQDICSLLTDQFINYGQ